MPKDRFGASKGHESQELYAVMGYLAVQPAGDIYIYEVTPHSAQSKNSMFDGDTNLLQQNLSKTLSKYSDLKNSVENQISSGRPGGYQVKVVFVLGSEDKEKDLDNMLKWFLDQWKEALGSDDSHITDLRTMKFRLSSDRGGFIGLSISPVSFKKGDLQSAQMIAINKQGKYKKSGYDPSDLNQLLVISREVMEIMSSKVDPQFK